MTITQVPSAPVHTELKTYDVDKTIAARHIAQLINNTSFLLGRNVENVVCGYPGKVTLAQNTFSNPTTPVYFNVNYDWFYTRSPDVQFAVISYEAHKSTLNSSADSYDHRVTSYFPAGVFFPADSDALKFTNNYVQDNRAGAIEFITFTGVVDVSALTPGVTYLFSLNIVGANATATNTYDYEPSGISKISMQELPKRYITISGVGLTGSSDVLSATPYRRIVDGDDDTEYGMARMMAQSIVAKNQVRNQWQIINHQQVGYPLIPPVTPFLTTHWFINSGTEMDLRFGLPGETLSVNDFNIRTRNYRGSLGATLPSLVNTYKLFIRYRTEDALPATGCQMRMVFESEPNSLAGSVTVPLPSSLIWTTAEVSVGLPCDEWAFQREQLVRLRFVGNTTGGTQRIYVSALYLVENET